MKVLAWTGLEQAYTSEDLSSIEQVFNLTKDLSGQFDTTILLDKVASVGHSPGFMSIARFCEAKYCRRLWIVQELVLAKHIEIRGIWYSFNWTSLESLFHDIHQLPRELGERLIKSLLFQIIYG